MSVALLLITHSDIGKTVHEAAVSVIGSSPLRTRFLSIEINSKPDEMINKAQELAAELDTGNGVLILTDMFGSTPSNIACTLQNQNVVIVAGLNLPMLIRILNYPNLSLSELADKAVSGGQEGVMIFHPASASDVAQTN
jgi:PTS system mannose-specific IIA component